LTARGVLVVGNEAWRLAASLLRRPKSVSHRDPLPRLALGLVGFLVVVNLAVYMPGQWKLYQGYNYVNADSIRAVAVAGIHNAVVFTEVGRWYEWWNYGSVFSSNSPLLDDDVVYARDLGLAKDRELMALYPGRRFYRLSNHELTEMK